jgi:hypothetical protein
MARVADDRAEIKRARKTSENPEPIEAATSAYDYFDVVRLRLTRPLSESELSSLRDNATDAWFMRGHYIRGFTDEVLTVNLPKERALQVLARLPGAIVNYLEISRDLIVPEGKAQSLQDRFDAHFVQPWHGRDETVIGTVYAAVSYTRRRRRGHWFGWYSDRPCKLTGEVGCFHLEARYQGAPAVRKLGIYHPRDLLNFDHAAHWAKHIQLFKIDYERLGRLYHNRRSGSRRSKPIISVGRFAYNRDCAAGAVLYNVFAWHPHQERHSVQQFVDTFGRGPFLIPMTL